MPHSRLKPASPEALAQGCTCPLPDQPVLTVIINGKPCEACEIDEDCPLHGVTPEELSAAPTYAGFRRLDP